MLLSFSVENFRSFKGEETLNLLASKRLGAADGLRAAVRSPPPKSTPSGLHRCTVRMVRENRILSKHSVFWKSWSSVARGRKSQFPTSHFLFDRESATKPTSFQVQFLEGGEVFWYGVCYDANRIHEEWLDAYEGKKDRNVFSRVSNEDGAVEVTLGPAATDSSPASKLKACASRGAKESIVSDRGGQP